MLYATSTAICFEGAFCLFYDHIIHFHRSFHQINSALQSVLSGIVTVSIARCMAMTHAKDVTVLYRSQREVKNKLNQVLHPASSTPSCDT